MTHRDALVRFLQAGPMDVKITTTTVAAVAAVLYQAVTSVLAIVLVVLFLCDVALGVLRAIDIGGLAAFDREKFGRALLRFMASAVGVLVAGSADSLLHVQGLVSDALPFTTAVLGFMCWGFVWSATANLAHFWPGVDRIVRAVLRRTGETSEQRRESRS